MYHRAVLLCSSTPWTFCLHAANDFNNKYGVPSAPKYPGTKPQSTLGANTPPTKQSI